MRQTRRWWVDLAIVALYALLTIGMTWPFAMRLKTHFADGSSDVWINPWGTWWTEKAISEGRSPYFTDLLFYPYGVSLVFHSFSHVNTAIALVLRPWLGYVGAENMAVLLAHALSGYTMFCLVRQITRSKMGAFLAGLVFAFFPYRMAESTHPGIVTTQWMPLYFLYLLQLVEKQRARHAVLAAAFLVLTALSYWHQMTFALVLSAAYLGYLLLVERDRWSKAVARNLIILMGLTGLMLVPFLYPIVCDQLSVSSSDFEASLTDGRGNDLIAYLLPPKGHPLWGPIFERAHERIGTYRTGYVGLLVLGLCAAGAILNWRFARFWILLALLSMLLAIGPYLQVCGHATGILVPWSVPITQLLRHPLRFNLLLGFALAVASGIGLSCLMDRLTAVRSSLRYAFAGSALALVLVEYLSVPFPITTEATVPGFYYLLDDSDGQRAVLGLPMGRSPSKRYMFYQMIHGRPIVEGHVSRTPLDAYAFIDTTPFLRSFLACGEKALPPADLSPFLPDLAGCGVQYVIVHKDLVDQLSLDTWLDTRTAPDYEDEQVAVYGTQAGPALRRGEAQLLEACLAVRSLLIGPISAVQGETLELPLEWIVGNSPQEEYVLELTLVDKRGNEQRRQYEVAPGTMTAWGRGYRHRATYPFQVFPLLPPGLYRLVATLVPEEGRTGGLLSAYLLDVQVMALSRDFEPPSIQKPVRATFGSCLRLLGYDLDVAADAVDVTTHWQTLCRMEVDYKFFVHVYDTKDKSLVAQADVMPRDWAYPTTWWEVGEFVSDEITVSLEDAPPGMYGLAVGVYDYETGIRAPVRDASGELQEMDWLVLPEKVQR